MIAFLDSFTIYGPDPYGKWTVTSSSPDTPVSPTVETQPHVPSGDDSFLEGKV